MMTSDFGWKGNDAPPVQAARTLRSRTTGALLGGGRTSLAVARDHPLAKRNAVDVEELADHRVLRFENLPQELSEAVAPSQTPGGRPIPGTRSPIGDHALLELPVRIARSEIVFPTVPSAAAYMGDSDLAFVPIKGMPPIRSALVWLRPAREPKLREFIRVAREVLGRAKTGS
jgi:LysR substrate binding domain